MKFLMIFMNFSERTFLFQNRLPFNAHCEKGSPTNKNSLSPISKLDPLTRAEQKITVKQWN